LNLTFSELLMIPHLLRAERRFGDGPVRALHRSAASSQRLDLT
jgi:hypothetical protein